MIVYLSPFKNVFQPIISKRLKEQKKVLSSSKKIHWISWQVQIAEPIQFFSLSILVSCVRCQMPPVTCQMSITPTAAVMSLPLINPPPCTVGCWWWSWPRSINNEWGGPKNKMNIFGHFWPFLSQSRYFLDKCTFLILLQGIFLQLTNLTMKLVNWSRRT